MTKRGVYSKKTKDKYLAITPKLDSEELVMLFPKKGQGKIVNQIMQSWETSYMKKLAEIATSKGGNILEVGFGMGISANFIEKSKKINSHSIIECHPLMIASAKKKLAKSLKKRRTFLLEGFWEDVVKRIPSKTFDGILFDSCPLDKEVELFQFFPFFNEAFRLLKDDGVFTYFSDESLAISNKHLKELRAAGFKSIKFEVCKVKPPKDCIYWKHNTIIAPIVKKF